MRSRIFCVLVFIFFFNIVYSQDVANFRFGTLLSSVKTDRVHERYGYNVGLAGRIGIPGFFIELGAYYQKFTIDEYEKIDFINDNPSYHAVKFNINLGLEYKVFKKGRLRFYSGGNLNYILEIDKNNRKINFDTVNYGLPSYNFGIGTTIYFVTLDFNYEKSITHFYNSDKNSKMDFYTLNLGFVF